MTLVITNAGLAKQAALLGSGGTLTFSKMSLGDGGGAAVTPTADATDLVNEVHYENWSAGTNPNFIATTEGAVRYATLKVPPSTGGFTVREIGLFDDDGDLIVYADYPAEEKPASGSGFEKTSWYELEMAFDNSLSIDLTIDPDLITATTADLEDYLPIAGGTMSGDIDMDDNAIQNLPTPSNSGDAVNKSYLDTELNTKADSDLSNILASGKNIITSAVMPDFVNLVPKAWNTVHTAYRDGWVWAYSRSNNASGYLIIDGASYPFQQGGSSTGYDSANIFIPVSKNTTYQATGGNITVALRFIPCKGSS